MENDKNIRPPRWATRLLTWYCRTELLEDLQGDLNEYFYRNLAKKGIQRARILYIIDVFKFFRSYTIRKPEIISLLIHWIMIGSYFTTSLRSIRRNKLFSAINIIGLSISMSVGLLMIAFLSDILSYDSFHEKKNNIYRVRATYHTGESTQRDMAMATTSLLAANKVKETIPGIETSTVMWGRFYGDAKIGSMTIPVEGLYADENFFTVFTFPMLQGNPAKALVSPYSIVLTEKTSKKLFGTEDALGKMVRFDTTDYQVTGIIKDVPPFSHMHFEILISYSTIEKVNQGDKDVLSWTNVWQHYLYLVLPEGSDTRTVQATLDKISREQNKEMAAGGIALVLQPLTTIAIGEKLSNELGETMPVIMVWIITGLAFVVILSACFNYTNLSIARSLRRAREVGIRKVVGAKKSHVMAQFIMEAVIISLIALCFSFALFLFLKTHFLSLGLTEMITMNLSPKLIILFILFAGFIGLTAGFLPAMFLSRIKAVQVLKDVTSLKIFGQLTMRRALIVFQFTLSLIFVTATIIGYQQYKSFLSRDLGFSTDSILNISMQGNKPDPLQKALLEMPEVTDISKSAMITSVGNYYSANMKYTDPHDSANVWFNAIDDHYLPLHDHHLLAGRNLHAKTANAVEDEVIVNEEILKRFNIAQGNPAKAIGEIVTVNKKKLQIVGVVKNFHYGTVIDKVEPLIFRLLLKEENGNLNVKIKSTDWVATLSRVEKAWKKTDSVHPLKASFYNDQIEKTYQDYSAMIKIVGFLTFLAICIASLGLLGMVVFTTETRLREISIRKVLGANEGMLVFLLSKGFLFMLLIASLVALPVTFFLFDKVILKNIIYRAPIGLVEMTSGLGMVAAIALVIILSQTLKASSRNPAEVLKNE